MKKISIVIDILKNDIHLYEQRLLLDYFHFLRILSTIDSKSGKIHVSWV